jgi:NTE family protein
MRGRRKGVGLALGAGGVLGGAWLAGSLAALAEATGWGPAAADLVLGTSAGSLFAALVAGGMAAHHLLPSDRRGRPTADDWPLADLVAPQAYRAPRGWTAIGPGSIGLALRAAREGAVVKTLCGLLPRGLVPTRTIESVVRRAVPGGWMRAPECWIVACDYATGRRVVFGDRDAPRPSLGQAVAASCAVPGIFAPVPFEGRLYVDGGLHSLSNLDLVPAGRVELVVALNPMSAARSRGGWTPLGRLTAAMRRWAARRAAAEVAQLRARGTEVLLLEPGEADLEAMGDDLMDAGRALRVAEVALATTAAALRRAARLPLVRRLAAS